jgi:hypothetical protein
MVLRIQVLELALDVSEGRSAFLLKDKSVAGGKNVVICTCVHTVAGWWMDGKGFSLVARSCRTS